MIEPNSPYVKLLHDHQAIILEKPSLVLVSKDVRRVADELVVLAQRRGLIGIADYAELVGTLVDFDLEVPKWSGCGGYFDASGRKISVQSGYSTNNTQSIICHEMSHAIQMMAGKYDSFSYLLSNLMNFEQEAETLSHYLQPILFPKSKPGYLFYFNGISDYEFLVNWYGSSCQNDLYELIE